MATDYNVEENLLYTTNHFWVLVEEDDQVLIGITDYAATEVRAVNDIELPNEGDYFEEGDELIFIAALNGGRDISLTLPFDATIHSVNEMVEANPNLMIEDHYEAGWLVRLSVDDSEIFEDLQDLGELMTPEEYTRFVETIAVN